MKRHILLACLLYVLLHVSASNPMGRWRTHLAYNVVAQIAQSDNKVYAVSEGALFSVNKLDGHIEFYSKMSGLSDTQIANIYFDDRNKQLLIIYQNGNIDILHQTGVSNIPDLRNKQMSASKKINNVLFQGNLAYLSTDFGILVLDMNNREIADTYIIGPNATEVPVLSTVVHQNQIYALTSTGVFTANVNNPNLVNFEFWSFSNNYPGSDRFQDIYSFGGTLVLLRNNILYKLENDNTWSTPLNETNIASCRVSGGRLIASGHNNNIHVFNEQFALNTKNLINSPDIEYDQRNDIYWVAGLSNGIMSFKLRNGNDPLITYFKPPGPAVNIPWDMTFAGEKLFIVNGGRFAVQFNRSGVVMIYENNNWTNIDAQTYVDPFIQTLALDFMNVAVNPNDKNHFFVTAYGSGLYEFRNNKLVNWYNHLNSNLFTIIPGNPLQFIRLDGAIFDSQSNLFVANMMTGSGIKILLNTGEWAELSFPNLSHETLGKILISNQNRNQKWVPSVRRTPGVFVWDDNGTLTDQSDDRSKFMNRFNDPDNVGSFFSPTNFFCMAQDKNGVVWVGTNMGPFLFHNPNRVFDENYMPSRIKIPRNDGTNLADFLLENERIKAIAIDGANRKWLGTESSGLYLMSENGQETIRHFTSSNSPLLSDNILSLAINPVSGELFIGTSAGLISFQSDAAEAGSVFSNVYAHPNPVRETYNGIITITGLVARTRVKITDINGNLIYNTISNGSIATWDGKDFHGRRVRTGIYLAICATEDGSQSTITKIMVIN